MACKIVQHDFESFSALRDHIWRTDKENNQIPHKFRSVLPGDHWGAYAYDTCQFVGFSECVSGADFCDAPQSVQLPGKAWFIKGRAFGEQPKKTVKVQHLENVLGRRVFRNQAIIEISDREFELLQKYILGQ